MQPDQIIVEPIITEKALARRALSGYVFKVHNKATKIDVALAIEKIFKVNVTSVNTCKVRSKRRVSGKSIGRTSSWKKAYVTLSKGQKIEELES
ncbi:MAG: 50S ribosomal protein L23 [bacterium]|nr:50S ribosomal protein L23 [Candidatus Margulisiibacteriota bacterium]